MLTFAKEVITFVDMILSHDHKAFVVGGSVRDALIGKITYDIDVCTSASVEQLKAIFSAQPITTQGERFLSLSIVFEGYTFQVTSFRSDSDYHHHRFPTSTPTASYHEDIMRRDFTVNGLLYNHHEGLIDLVGGLDDIRLRIIRTIGDPYVRLMEDGLRICRALRFASECQFLIEANTYAAMLAHAPILRQLSRERLTDEVMKTLKGIGVNAVITQCRNVFKAAFQFSYYYDTISLEHHFHPLAMWYSVFKSRHQPIETVISLFAFNRHEAATLLYLDRVAHMEIVCDKVKIKHILKNLSMDRFVMLCHLKVITNQCDQAFLSAIMEHVHAIISNSEAYLISHLMINGNDCLRWGMQPLSIGHFLEACLEDVIATPEHNTREYLMHACKEWKTTADQ